MLILVLLGFEVHDTLSLAKHLVVGASSDTTSFEAVDGTKLTLKRILILVLLMLQVNLDSRSTLLVGISSHLIASVQLVRTPDSLLHVESIKLILDLSLVDRLSSYATLFPSNPKIRRI